MPTPTHYDVKVMPLAELKEHPQNPRYISPEALKGLVASIGQFGLIEPIIWNRRTGHIVGGHQRKKALEAAGYTEAQVLIVDFDERREMGALLSLNNARIQGEWSDAAPDLLLQYEEWNPAEFADLALDELRDDLNPTIRRHGQTDPDSAPEMPKEATVRLNERWILGEHQLLCGDSLNKQSIDALFASEKADMVFTDPPYNVDYEGYTEEKLTIQNDKMTPDAFWDFLVNTFKSYRDVVKDTASLYVCHPSSYQREFQTTMELSDFHVRCQIIWAKNTFGWGFGRYKFQHEPIFYAHVVGAADAWYGDKSQSTLWQEKKPAANRLHPTMKPVELVLRALQNSSKPGDIVADLFGGSGTTLIAAEMAERRARLVELDPRYCDVIIQRWEAFTGKKAVRA